jgi:hypothetical protein
VTSNDVSDQVPADLTDITGLDPVTMAAMDSAINMAWPPATSSVLSPLQEIMAFDVGGMTISPFGQFSNSARSTIPVSTIMSDDLGWLFN